MTLLTLNDVERSHGDLTVFEGVSLRIGEGERIGVVGDNGSGKTTLLRVLVGLDPPDRGERTTCRGLRIAYAEQIPALEPGTTVLEAAHAAFGELDALEAELRVLEAGMAERPDDPQLLRRYEDNLAAFEAGGGWDRERFAERTLTGLGFTGEQCAQDVATLSGGQKARVALARVLLRPADLLILDEPTNHLDLDGIAFLEDLLERRRAAFLVVSHDRHFLDRLCRSIVEVEGGRVTRYRGSYRDYRRQKQAELERGLDEYRKQQDFVAKEMEFIRRHMGSRRTAEARGRLKRLRRLELLARPAKERQVRLSFGVHKARGLTGQTILEGAGVGFAFPGHAPLFRGLDFRVYFGDRVALLGRNGVGKSTLLHLLAGERAVSEGRIERAAKLRIARFTQEMEDLPPSGSVLAALRVLVPIWDERQLRDHLAAFGFSQDDVDKEVPVLSGGEKRRLCLARLTASDFDVLLLDEPTNHLDLVTREALEEALAGFPGTVVMVSHDRWFLDTTATRVFELDEGGLQSYDDGLAYYLGKRAELRRAEGRDETARRDEERRRERAGREQRPAEGAEKPTPQDSGRVRNPYAFARLEERIIELEGELEAVREAIAAPEAWKDPELLKTNHGREAELGAELAELYRRWEDWE